MVLVNHFCQDAIEGVMTGLWATSGHGMGDFQWGVNQSINQSINQFLGWPK